jgi:hypothetical protein
VFWLGGNSEKAVPIVKYVVKISHKGLLLWSYSDYQKELSDKVLDLRDREKLTFNAIAEKLILEGYRSPRGFDLGVELQRKVSHYLQPILSHRFLNNLA